MKKPVNTLEGFSKVIQEIGDKKREEERLEVERFLQNKDALIHDLQKLDHEDLIEAFLDAIRPRSNYRLMIVMQEYSMAIRKEMLKRMGEYVITAH